VVTSQLKLSSASRLVFVSVSVTFVSQADVQRSPNATESDAAIRDRLAQAIQTRLIEQRMNVTPLVSINVLETPERNP
jgi:uncharacterized membrane protein